MASRVGKYYGDDDEMTTSSTRSSRNARLYKQVYGKYENMDNLPLEDNTAEIDMERLKELVLNSGRESRDKELREHLNVLEQKKRNIDEQKVYDINKILEQAKYENNKLKENTSSIPKIDKSFLSTLRSTELSIPELKQASDKYDEERKRQEVEEIEKIHVLETEEKLSMTRELKYHNLVDEENEVREATSDLSLDLFSDLKPTGNTIVTKPIIEEVNNVVDVVPNLHSSDTRDIDIIKEVPGSKESDFFTNSYEFSKKDFAYDDDFADLNSKGGIWKILLLIFTIFMVVGVITYFVITYGIGIS